MNRRALLFTALAGAGAAASACAPTTPLLAPQPAAVGRLEADGFTSFDGARVPMTVWPAKGLSRPRAIIVGLHGMNDWAQAFGLAAPFWANVGVATYALDQRGFGRSSSRGLWSGDETMAEDLRVICALLRRANPGVPIAVVGESMGGAVAIVAFASDRPPQADRLILASPAVWGWGAQPPSYAAALWLTAHVAPSATLEAPSWVAKKITASDNREELLRMGRDRRMLFKTRVDCVYGLMDLMQHGRERIGQVKGPVLYLYGAHDDLIPKKAAFFAAGHLPPGGRTAYYASGYHLLTRDLQAQTVWTDILSFIADPSGRLPSDAPPIPGTMTDGRRTAAATTPIHR